MAINDRERLKSLKGFFKEYDDNPQSVGTLTLVFYIKEALALAIENPTYLSAVLSVLQVPDSKQEVVLIDNLERQLHLLGNEEAIYSVKNYMLNILSSLGSSFAVYFDTAPDEATLQRDGDDEQEWLIQKQIHGEHDKGVVQ